MTQAGTPIGRKLALTSKLVGASFNAALSAEGGSVPIWLILSILQSGPQATQLEMARALGVEAPTINRHLDNLERIGYVTRQRSEADRRATVIHLTPAGKAAYDRMRGAVISFNKRLTAGISRDELHQLDDLLSRLAANISE